MSSDKQVALRLLETLGHNIFYAILLIFGQAGAYLLLIPVTLFYLGFSRKIHLAVGHYLKRRFPGHGFLQRWLDTFRLVLSFGQVLVDRGWLGLRRGARLKGELVGQDELQQLITKGKGLVLLTAHVGNWQTALAHICGFSVPVNSLMRYGQEEVTKHYFDLQRVPVPFTIINSDGFMGGMIEATVALQRGEVVTIMGDRYAGGAYSEVEFLGDRVRFPAGAYSLAAATGAPVVIMLAAKLGRQSYRIKLWDVFYPEAGERSNRQEDLARWAGRFAKSLEGYLEKYPYQWYNFFDFWRQ